MRDGEIIESNDPNTPIEPGDCLSIDAGLQYLHFQTDMKRSAYVLRPGETAAPRGMQKALAAANAVTDRLIAQHAARSSRSRGVEHDDGRPE